MAFTLEIGEQRAGSEAKPVFMGFPQIDLKKTRIKSGENACMNLLRVYIFGGVS